MSNRCVMPLWRRSGNGYEVTVYIDGATYTWQKTLCLQHVVAHKSYSRQAHRRLPNQAKGEKTAAGNDCGKSANNLYNAVPYKRPPRDSSH